jgi:hypothetical protein
MDIFFQDPAAIPLPPDEVRILEFRAEPWSDNRRIRIRLSITPFQKRPNGEIAITDDEGTEVAAFSIIETISPKMEFTVHLRGGRENGQFTASVILFYYEEEPDRIQPHDSPEGFELPAKTRIVDRAQAVFEIQA